MSPLVAKLDTFLKQGAINLKLKNLILDFHGSYIHALKNSPNLERSEQLFGQLIDLVVEKLKNPYHFEIFHRAVRQPFDYYQFGLDFMRPFVDFSLSKIFGLDSIKQMQAQLQKGENVILLANHQIEPDPQIISLLLERIDPQLAAEMIFVAGHRVISDPMAIPMSLGRNLLCIYSKKHMAHPPEEKAAKVLHNQRTLKQMQELLNKGGNCIYVAPSGGRDRKNAAGEVDVAPFDPHSVELFWLMGSKLLADPFLSPGPPNLSPHAPPSLVEKDVGEKRVINISPCLSLPSAMKLIWKTSLEAKTAIREQNGPNGQSTFATWSVRNIARSQNNIISQAPALAPALAGEGHKELKQLKSLNNRNLFHFSPLLSF